MSKLIKLPASALHVPEDELLEFTHVFKCNPEDLGTIVISVSDKAVKVVREIMTSSIARRVVLEEPGVEGNHFLDRLEYVPAGLIDVQHNSPGSGFFIRRVDVLRDSDLGPRIHIRTFNGRTHWWLYYKLDRIPLCAALTPSIRYRIDYQDEDNNITE